MLPPSNNVAGEFTRAEKVPEARIEADPYASDAVRPRRYCDVEIRPARIVSVR